MRAAAKPGLEVEPVAEAGRAGGQAGATTMVGAAISNYYAFDFPCGRCYIISLKLHDNDVHAGKILGYSFTIPHLQSLELSFCSIMRAIFHFDLYLF